jgi:radical SAM superfamily enzyme YgiQ (UPF0313 family)
MFSGNGHQEGRSDMKILLIKPPLNPHLISPSLGEPLELEYLASAVKEQDVEIFDMRFDKNLMSKLEDFKPDLVGLTCCTCDVNMAKEVMKEVKKFSSRIKTVVGGCHASVLPSDFALPFVDAIFIGVADHSFKRYSRLLEEGGHVEEVKNLALVDGEKLRFTEEGPMDMDLDSLPFPSRHLTAKYRKKYKDQMGNRTAMILSSRGCPFRCTFCSCWKMTGGKYMVRDPESVAEEMAGLPDDTDLVFFADDNTLHSIQRAWRLSEAIKKRRIGKKFSMYARADTIVKHPDLIRSLKEAGLVSLTVGIESSRDNELDEFRKKTTVEINSQAIRILQKLGIDNVAHFIVHPHFVADDFDHLYRYVLKMDLFQPVYTVLTPSPGTELYTKFFERLLIKNYDYYDHIHSVLPTALSRREFYRQVANLYRKTYSFTRYFKSKFEDLKRAYKGSGEKGTVCTDRISFRKLLILHLTGYPLYFKYLHLYKTEPLISEYVKTGPCQVRNLEI